MSQFASFRQVFVVALGAATLALMPSGAVAGSIVYSFKLQNQALDSDGKKAAAYDYHLSIRGVKAADVKLNSSDVNSKAWVNRPVTQAGTAVNLGWSTNTQKVPNPLPSDKY